MAITGVIDTFKTGTYAVTRTTAPTVSAGRRVAGSTSVVNIDLSIQPAMGSTLKALPAARQTEDVRVIYSKVALRDLSGGNEPDVISIDGEAFEVFKVERWPRHWRAYAARQVRP